MKYYLMRRPYSPGAAPREGLVSFENYDERKFVEDAACMVWAQLVYDRELPDDELDAFEIAESGHKLFYKVCYKADKNGNVIIASVEKVYTLANRKPANSAYYHSRDKRYSIHTDWFGTQEEADAFIAEATENGIHI